MSTANELRTRALARQKLQRAIREYFAQHQVLEVETPIMDLAGNTDPAIESFELTGLDQKPKWLRTSPEFFHKRLLAQGFGDLFEFAKVFRDDESSTRHRNEFTLLEYYRVGFDAQQLIADLSALFAFVAQKFARPVYSVRSLSFRAWFAEEFGIDPIQAPLANWQSLAHTHGAQTVQQFDRDQCLDFLRACVLEPKLDQLQNQLVFVTDFPATQAALARINSDFETAARFELFVDGIELANGYHELTDPNEQLQRFQHDQLRRQQRGQRSVAIDQPLIAALHCGLPDCAGVAIGLDRWLMHLLEACDLQQVMLF